MMAVQGDDTFHFKLLRTYANTTLDVGANVYDTSSVSDQIQQLIVTNLQGWPAGRTRVHTCSSKYGPRAADVCKCW